MEEPYGVVVLAAREPGLRLLAWLAGQTGCRVLAAFTHARLPRGEDPARGPRPDFPRFVELARRGGFPLHAVDRGDQAGELEPLLALPAVDFLLSLSWRYLVPPAALAKPRLAAINLHRGLLPAYGGAEPVRRMLADGRDQAVITAHLMSGEIDRGEVLCAHRQPMAMRPGETPATAACRVKAELVPHYPQVAADAINLVLARRGLPARPWEAA